MIEKKRCCLWNIMMEAQCRESCRVSDEDCKTCKAYLTEPLGLKGLYSGGFKGIQKKQYEGSCKKRKVELFLD